MSKQPVPHKPIREKHFYKPQGDKSAVEKEPIHRNTSEDNVSDDDGDVTPLGHSPIHKSAYSEK
ncbi:MAG: hypothetical protein GY740_21180 [Gammaproteobacteria bacterium]|nr:hypothetical protein [Gammaproteobacteria bacterium]